ncbi:hypothetical protein CROQUDRAFT_713715 [Cronartium quercuum f. sp. fusiforme G11]|uniref:Uncharacterized protein n=1 Tax=Cronartium quercuum f. sp. fusiforme G11 TaxID=708437 RepID=A0A9P6NT86_9BASI|nr:hypothetical protein CROQUDRAFT_713715 [Cronartium quercuum f. sp. fusiforme G11]
MASAGSECIVAAGGELEYAYKLKDSDLFGYLEPGTENSGERPHYWALDTTRPFSTVPRFTPQDHKLGWPMTPERGSVEIFDLGVYYTVQFTRVLSLPVPWMVDHPNPERFTCLEIPSFRQTTMPKGQVLNLGYTLQFARGDTRILEGNKTVAAAPWEIGKARCVLTPLLNRDRPADARPIAELIAEAT